MPTQSQTPNAQFTAQEEKIFTQIQQELDQSFPKRQADLDRRVDVQQLNAAEKRLLLRLKSLGPKRMLALDGGGIRGALTLGILEKMEAILQDKHGRKDMCLADYFDFIGGTSTGSIIACALAVGTPVREITRKYLDLGDVIFGKKRRWWVPWEIPAYLKAEFDFQPLVNSLRDFFSRDAGTTKEPILVGDEEIRTGLCVVTKRADTFSTWPIVNIPIGKYYQRNKYPLWMMTRASAAAPTYFISQDLDIGDGRKRPFIDGGVSMANNPALQLFLIATLKGFRLNWEVGDDKLLIVSVGTGTSEKVLKEYQKVGKRNLLGWARSVPDYFMEDASQLNQTVMQYLSNSMVARHIDGEIGNLEHDLLHNKAALSYLRYNFEFNVDNLKQLGYHYQEQQIPDLVEMSNAANKELLYEIGQKVGENLVSKAHFPDQFDLAG